MKRAWPLVSLGCFLFQDKSYLAEPENRLYKKMSVKLYGKGVSIDSAVEGSSLRMRRHQLAKTHQIVVSEIWAKKGAIGIVSDECSGALCTSHFYLFDHDPSKIDIKWLSYLLASNMLESQLDEYARGTTGYAAIRPSQFLSCEVPLPPLAEQQKIAARIGEIQMKLQSIEILLSAIEVDLQSLFLSLHNDSGMRCKLGDLIELYEDKERIQPTASYPQVGVRGFGGGLFPKAAVSGAGTTYKTFNRLYEDAIVLSQVKGWEGAIAICPMSLSGMFVSPEYRTFRCKPEMTTPKYMQEVVRSKWFWKYLQEATRGVGARRERVRPEKFLAIELHMPSLAEQEIIVAMLSALQIARRLRAEAQQAIDALFPSVLDRELFQTHVARE
jgi:type I restriction enzyme, S subunit